MLGNGFVQAKAGQRGAFKFVEEDQAAWQSTLIL